MSVIDDNKKRNSIYNISTAPFKQHGPLEHVRFPIDDNLARIFLLLVERFSRKATWTDYYFMIDEMKSVALEQLLNRWHIFDSRWAEKNPYKMSKGKKVKRYSNPFGYYTSFCSTKFTGCINAFTRERIKCDNVRWLHGVEVSPYYEADRAPKESKPLLKIHHNRKKKNEKNIGNKSSKNKNIRN